MEMENTAGEAMDDLLRAGAEASFGAVDFDDSFAVVYDDEDYSAMPEADYASPRIDPALLVEDAEDSGVEGVGFNFDSVNAGVRAGEEGDVEDNGSASVSPTAKSPGRGRKKVTTTTTASLAARKPAVANTKTKLIHPSAGGTRTSTRIAKTQPAASPAGKKQGKPKAKAAQLQAKNRRLMTAWAATLRGGKKARKINSKALPLRGSAAGGRSVRLRNWRGEVIDEGDGKGVVVVCVEEETDGEGYELC